MARGFKKLDEEITLAMGASLPHASYEAVRAAKIFEALGVNVAQAAKDPMTALETLSKTLGALPDGAIKSYTANQLLGRGYQDFLPILNRLDDALLATKKTSDQLASGIGGAAQAGDTLAAATTNLSNQWRTLETTLATLVIPVLTNVISLINAGFSRASISNLLPPLGPRVPRDINGNPLPQAATLSSAAAAALLSKASGGVSLGSNPGGLQTQDTLKQLFSAAAMDSTGRGRGGRGGGEFLTPLFIGKAASEWDKYEREVVKAYEAHQKLLDAMKKSNAQLFLENSILSDLNGPIGMAIGSPDKTGAGIQKFFDKINEANSKTAKQAADEWKRQFESLKNSAGQLFDSMLQGARSFGDTLRRIVLGALLSPIKDMFSTQIAKLLQGIEGSVQKSVQKHSGKSGGFFAKILNALGLGGTPNAPTTIAQQHVGTLTAGSLTILGGSTQIPKPSNLFSDFFGGGGGSLSSLSGIGGLSLALAAPGAMAVAGSGGANVAGPGGTINPQGGILGSLRDSANALAANPLKTGLSGALLLGTGLATHNGAATALGIGLTSGALLTQVSKMLQPSLGGIGKALGLSPKTSGLGNVLGVLGKAAPGIGLMFAGNQTGGLAGTALGAGGGALAGFEIGSLFGPAGAGIGAAIGAVGGAIMGIFGKKNNQAAWERAVTRAANNQRITQPMTENFAFAAMNTIGKTFSTTFGQGPGGFSNSTLAANTPFFANAILGTPRGTRNKIAWNALLNGVNPNSPFFGGTNNPFTGGPLPNGLRLPGAPTGAFSPNAGYGTPSGGSNVSVHFTVPGYVDKAGLADIVKTAEPLIHRSVARSVYQQSSGMRRAVSRAINLP